jgi:hypothetical protein
LISPQQACSPLAHLIPAGIEAWQIKAAVSLFLTIRTRGPIRKAVAGGGRGGSCWLAAAKKNAAI